jgi:YHS domain-containing protein
MASSSVSVVANALFLKRFEPKTEQQLNEEKLLLEEKAIDPICGMEVVPSRALEYKYKGTSYYFCNPNCEAEFKLDPEKYKNFDNIDPKLMHKGVTQGDEKAEEDLIEVLKCSHCGIIQKMPEHCGKPMHKEGDQLVCWMGASCGAQPISEHCGKEMEIVKINKEELNTLEQKEEVKVNMGKLKCVECGSEQDIPLHCGKPMHKEGDQLVCWMGASCGAQPIPEHHGKSMDVIEG